MTRECNTGRQSLLMDIQKVDFMLVDLNLFLDTHPDCAEALQGACQSGQYLSKAAQLLRTAIWSADDHDMGAKHRLLELE